MVMVANVRGRLRQCAERAERRRGERLPPPECFEATRMLGAYLDRELHPANVVRLERHLLDCDMCSSWLATLRTVHQPPFPR